MVTVPPVESARATAALMMSLLMVFPLFILTRTKPGEGIMVFFSAIAAFNNAVMAVTYLSVISSGVFFVIMCSPSLQCIVCVVSIYRLLIAPPTGRRARPAGRPGCTVRCTSRVTGGGAKPAPGPEGKKGLSDKIKAVFDVLTGII
jgi:hypothetical protein